MGGFWPVREVDGRLLIVTIVQPLAASVKDVCVSLANCHHLSYNRSVGIVTPLVWETPEDLARDLKHARHAF